MILIRHLFGWSLVLIFSLFIVSTYAWSKELDIVRDGQARAEIVVAPKPARMVTLAASELQQYIERISGGKVAIVTTPTDAALTRIYVGVSEHTTKLGLSDDGLAEGAYHIRTGPNWLALLGHDSDFTPREPYAYNRETAPELLTKWDALTGETWENPTTMLYKSYSREMKLWEQDERGSLNAVYALLQRWGVRWYMPGEWGEHVPKRASLSVPATNQTISPAFGLRWFMQYGHNFGLASRDETLWQLRLGLNNSDRIIGTGTIVHGIAQVHGREETKAAHPEYFALMTNGKRATEPRSGTACLSSPELFDANVRYARACFDIYNHKSISVMPEDGFTAICQCPPCVSMATPDRGYDGIYSDYVWDYVNRVAAELYKTHPDRKVINFAYTTYFLPPEKIQTLSPNVVVGICENRAARYDATAREKAEATRNAWLKKTPSSKLISYDYYLAPKPNKTWFGIPVVFPHQIAEDMRTSKGRTYGDVIEVYRRRGEILDLAVNHLNLYFTARFYWDVNQDADAMLQEYYQLQYGPAASQMKDYFEHAQANWMKMTSQVDALDKSVALLEAARQAADPQSIYGKRIGLIVKYTAPIKDIRERLVVGRQNVPKIRVAHSEAGGVRLDGRDDEPFWERTPKYSMSDLTTGKAPVNKTSMKINVTNDAIYLFVRCADNDAKNLNITAKGKDDPGIWNGDNIEVLLESQSHSYYQLVFNPAGAMADVDRKSGINTAWKSGVEYACLIDDGGWNVEMRIPFTNDLQADVDPDFGVAGRKPSATYPWFFNVCRQRVRPDDLEYTALSPTLTKSFHDRMKFAELLVK